jgi:hypothetical protein
MTEGKPRAATEVRESISRRHRLELSARDGVAIVVFSSLVSHNSMLWAIRTDVRVSASCTSKNPVD